MDDTQWPRYQVFKQDRPDGPFEDVGSVHAPDAELALQNARDVYVRRPECAGLWVVPAEVILARSGDHMAAGEERPDGEADHTPEPFLVFVKWEQSGTHVYSGLVEASSPTRALTLARSSLDDPNRPGIVWWVCPARAVVQSSPDEAESLFGPARGKLYRQPAHYRTDSMMRAIRARTRREKDDSD